MNFVFDLDGTLCFQGLPLSQPITKALHSLEKVGHRVIFASARPIRDLLPVLPETFHHHLLIGGNGSLVSHRGEIVYSKHFSQSDVIYIQKLIQQMDATYLVDGLWNYSYTGTISHPIRKNLDPLHSAKNVSLTEHDTIIKVLILSATSMPDFSEALREIDVVSHSHGEEQVLDISPKGIHKRNALHIMGITTEGYVAFGNDANDIEMFKGAVHSVMIGSHVDLATYADEQIPLNGLLEEQLVAKLRELSLRFSTENCLPT
ncbi:MULTISPECIES: HAD-IIB family hydrolase [unclassified Exiguobacterium]|uniref:HAD-IIB family hydrolase n=1 Tax=unclassified Exiguobacterium TaxID=2644629 RepID=UPI000B590368|nr:MULTISPECIES: HAD family hydrolase [unclassified Exiguobacterium]ASI35256.1 HAD family hydrolase [Exiguobacterium sp. N4-1P]ASI37269.1 HAD family hydrolase [Exiguobacterium sp. N4-1P]